MASANNMPGLGNHQKGNLIILFNEGQVPKRKCGICKHTIRDIVCFCKKCGNYLHLKCAGVGSYYTHHGKNQVMLPLPEELPKSCHECLRIKRRDQSRRRFHKSTNQSAHNLEECKKNDKCLSHTSMQGHKLEKKNYGTVYKCFVCKEKGFGSHHVCRNASCSFRLHEHCKSPRKSITHKFFPRLSFAFSSPPTIKYCNQCEKKHSTISCNACGMYVNGYFYQSNDGTKHLHPCCANLPHQIKCGESGTTMKLEPNTTTKCSYCHEASMMVGNKKTAQIWSYVSQCRNNIHLHVPCMRKMLSDFKVIDSTSSRANGSTSVLTLHKKTEVNNMTTKLEFQIEAAADAKKKWERKFKKIMKYAKIVLGAIISACLGDPTPFLLNCIVAFIS